MNKQCKDKKKDTSIMKVLLSRNKFVWFSSFLSPALSMYVTDLWQIFVEGQAFGAVVKLSLEMFTCCYQSAGVQVAAPFPVYIAANVHPRRWQWWVAESLPHTWETWIRFHHSGFRLAQPICHKIWGVNQWRVICWSFSLSVLFKLQKSKTSDVH